MKKILIIFSCIIATSCLIGAMLLSSCDSTPIAKNGDTVQVNYTLTLADGTLYQTTVGNQPLEFVIGEGDYLPDFEKAIVGMKVGESKTITILSADAYGDIREDLICTLDKSQLAAGVEPKVGDTLKTTDTSGRTIVVVVTAVSDTTLTIDANFPLAGKDLTFIIELLKIS